MPSKMRFCIAACCMLVILSSYSSAKTVGHKKPVRGQRSVAKASVPSTPGQHALDLEYLPINIAVYAGAEARFSCRVDPGVPSTPRIVWTEYAYLPEGQIISENGVVLGHPQAARYRIDTTGLYQFDLVISDVVLADGGIYSCADGFATVPQKQRHAAYLIVIAAPQNCTTVVPENGHVVEGLYYTHECTLDYKGGIVPRATWTGPAPFSSGETNTSSRLWSGLSFTADRTMASQQYVSTINFISDFLPVPIDTADNVPDWVEVYLTGRMTVNWPPKNLYVEPVKPLDEYEVGDIIYCRADAFPTGEFRWTNTRTAEVILNDAFEILPALLGTTQIIRCSVINTFNGLNYTGDIFVSVIVPLPTTLPETTTPTTTTPPPAVSDCLEMSGRWLSVQPVTGDLCLTVNGSNGAFNGGFRNGTDSFWALITGNVHQPQNEHIAFSIIWPDNIAVSSMIGECSRCFGQEVILVSAITRSKGMVTCGVPGDIRYSDQYTFIRSSEPCLEFRPPA